MTEIRGYTLAQVEAFTKAAAAERRRQSADSLINLRASQYNESNFMKRYKQLTD